VKACLPRKWTVPLWGLVFVSMVLPSAMVHTARGQATNQSLNVDSLQAALGGNIAQPVNVDSIIAAVQAQQVGVKLQLKPTYIGNILGNVTFVQMKNVLQTRGRAWGGTILTGLVRLDKKVYRLQNRFEENKVLSATANRRFNPQTAIDVNFSDNRQFSRAVALGGGFQDFILNNISATGGLAYQTLSGHRFRWDGRLGATAVNGEKIFKTDETQSASLNGGAAYTHGLFGTVFTLGLRGARKQTWETSRTATGVNVFALSSFQVPGVEPLGGHEDSVAVAFTAVINDSTKIRVDYVDYLGVKKFADQARGSLGSQVQGEAALIYEKETRSTRGMTIGFNASPFHRVTMRVDARHMVTGTDYENQLTRISEVTADAISTDITYYPFWGSNVTARVERAEQFRWLGPQSVGSFDELRKRFNFSLQHHFKPTLSLQARYDTQLSQAFYVDPTNPRDRDQLDNSVNVSLNSTPWEPFRVTLSGSYIRTEYVNMDASQSFNNRVKQRYDLRPGFDLRVSDRFSVQQNYGMAWELTEFPFHPDDDALDRTITFSNTFRLTFTQNLNMKFDYLMDLHDRGAYLPLEGTPEPLRDTAQRFFIPTNEDRRDRIAVSMRYRIGAHLSAVLDYDYSQRVDFIDGPDNDNVTRDGGIQGGLVGRYTWGTDKELRFEIKKANRFGAFSNELQNDFWIANSELKYAF